MEESLFKKVSRRENYTLYEQLPGKHIFFVAVFIKKFMRMYWLE